MRILRIKLRSYRGVAEREVRLAPSGVTVIQGPNESGKSSLAEAVDVVFKHLDSSAKAEIKALKPVHADEGAEVEVDVECGAYAFTLFKRFHKRPATRLEVQRPRPESHTGREAHDRARAILAEAIDLDLWDALRLEQGTGVEQAELKDQSALARALDRAAGSAAAGGREESLFEAARAEYDRYFTETGKPRKELEESDRAVATARQELEGCERGLAALEADIARSARLESEIARLRGEQARLKSQAEERQAQWQGLQSRRAAIDGLEAKRRGALAVEKGAVAEVEAREKLVAEHRGAAQERQTLEAEVASRSPARQEAEAAFRKAADELRAARAAQDAAEGLLRLRREDQAFRDRELNLDLLRERKVRVDAALESARRADEELRGLRMTAALLEEIEKAHVAVEVARSRVEAASTAVDLEALGAVEARIGGRAAPLEPGEHRTLVVEGTLDIELPGLLRLSVRAAASPEAVAREHEAALRRIRSLCEKGGVANLAGARSANEARKEAERVLARRDQTLQADLRDLTLEGLAQRIADLESRHDYLARRPAEPPMATDLDAAVVCALEAEAALAAAVALRERAEKALDRARAQHESQQSDGVRETTRLKLLGERIGAAERALEAARAARSDEELRLGREAASDAARVAAEEHRLAAAQLAAEQPELVEERARNAQAALDSVRRQLRQQEDELLEVGTRLRALGEDGLETRRGEAQARFERLSLEREGLLARASAARVLFETLRDARDAARRRYVAPLRERIERLGRYVFGPSLQIDLDDDLQIQSRTLEGRTVPFRDLSIGAQEQLGVISRLACAMTVAPDGGVPVILDDALGYSDPQRLEEMGAVLAIAGREAQVIVLTCLPERYRHVGSASVVRLG